MDDILLDVVNSEDLKKWELKYNSENKLDELSSDTRFNYAYCLIRSKYPADVRKGLQMFEAMYNEDKTEEGKRQYLYFMALGHARIKDYCKSLNYCESFLKVEPSNKQVRDLQSAVRKRMKKEGLEGLAVAGTAAIVVGGLVGLGLALAKSSKSS
ncbi:mitochondrial fission 1 protein-like [Lycorma delicatula]|uniref:mitochondrial fission 1 protein-like n=1 Tax=Lycorma delicatula TaxID=130591 RepID=UPI003F51A56D